MTDTFARPIPKNTEDGVVEIPASAWAEVKRVAEEELGATISVHDHDAPGAFHGRPFLPFAHYLFEVTLEEELFDDFMELVHPLIEDVIARHTQQLAVPAGM
jgi:hypothetical protein